LNNVHPDDRGIILDAQKAYLEDSNLHSFEYRIRCKKGDYRWVQSRGRALRDAAGRPTRTLGNITDVTERRQAEALIEESRSSLARAEEMALLVLLSQKVAADA
jgi:two-component system sensor histidine kinase UhpB